MLPELGKSAQVLAQRAERAGFFQTCVEARGPHELKALPAGSHPAVDLINHTRQHGVPIAMPRRTAAEERVKAVAYGTYASAHKERDFLRTELLDQTRAGHIVVFHLSAVKDLPNLWLSPVASIPQTDRQPRLIYELSWIGVNAAEGSSAPPEAMHFTRGLHRVLYCILVVDPVLGPVYLCKANLLDAYMRIWYRPEDIPAVGFLVPREDIHTEQLIRFHLSLLMSYIESDPLFYAATETVVEFANDIVGERDHALSHLLEDMALSVPATSANTPEEVRPSAACAAAPYLKNPSIVKGGLYDHLQIIHHLFQQIDTVFHPKMNSLWRGKSRYPLKICGSDMRAGAHARWYLAWP